MKAYLQKLIGTAVLGLALASNSIPVWAGYVDLSEVEVVTDLANVGRGTMAGARYSADNRQYIGCTLQHSGGPFVRCYARDKTGKSLFCTSTDATLVNAAKALTDYSSIAFRLAPGTSSCESLSVSNSSSHLK